MGRQEKANDMSAGYSYGKVTPEGALFLDGMPQAPAATMRVTVDGVVQERTLEAVAGPDGYAMNAALDAHGRAYPDPENPSAVKVDIVRGFTVIVLDLSDAAAASA